MAAMMHSDANDMPQAHSHARLRFENIARRFAETPAVDGISFDVMPGEVVCLVGPSGCGKTTTLRIAAGVERPDSGLVHVGGQEVAGPGVFVPPEARSVGLMFQDYALFPHLDVAANVAFGINKLPRNQRESRVKQALERVRLGHLARAFPHELSGGEQQRVALARAFAPEPQLILMDEPFSGLDQELRRTVRGETLAILRDLGMGALIVTHDPEEALEISDRIVLMRQGKIVQNAGPEDIWRRPTDRAAAAFMGEINALPCVVEHGKAQTPWGPVDCSGVADGPAEILVRPADLEVVMDASAPEFEVQAVKFLGATYVLDGELRPLNMPPAQVRARFSLKKAPSVGEMLHLGCVAKAILIFSLRT